MDLGREGHLGVAGPTLPPACLNTSGAVTHSHWHSDDNSDGEEAL